MLVVTCVSLLQGGGPESDDEDMADPFNGKRFTVCMFLPMETVTFSERVKVVEVGNLVEIPSEIQVRQAISKLYKKKEEDPDKFSYIQFPFGVIDYEGLQILQTYHEYLALRKRIAEEKAWFKQAKQSCEDLGINIESIYRYFKDRVWSTTSTFNPTTCIRNLVGKRWLTDDVIETVFDIINMKHDDTICFVCKPTRAMYSSVRLHEKVRNVRENGITVSKILVALNVGCDDNGSCYVSDEKKRGVHWALLVIDLKNGVTYYGDSLGWPLPSNLSNTVGSNLKRMEGDLGINIMSSLKNIITINKVSRDTSDSGTWFYPLQTCSDMCGVIVVCMCAVLCDYWNLWLTCGGKMETVHVQLLSKPSMNSRQLRLIVMSWIVNDNVTTCNLALTTEIKGTSNTSNDQENIDTKSTTKLSDSSTT